MSRLSLLVLTSLLACVGKAPDTAPSPADDTDTDVDTHADTGPCLTLDPTILEITPAQMNGFVTAAGCVDGLTATCTEPYRVDWSETDGAWLVAVDPVSQAERGDGTCTFTSTSGTATLVVDYSASELTE